MRNFVSTFFILVFCIALSVGLYHVVTTMPSETIFSAPTITQASGDIPAPPVLRSFSSHIQTPESVRAIYMTAWTAGSRDRRSSLVDFITSSEINSVVIDIKDDTGKVSFPLVDEPLSTYSSGSTKISDARNFINELHEHGIYVIGRIAAFQDPHITSIHPEWAVKRSDQTTVWTDRKGQSWVDAGEEGFWNYIVTLAEYSHDLGFDEINFDYIRFPSDGNMSDIWFPVSEGKSYPEVLKGFYSYLDDHLRSKDIPISADLFGMTTTHSGHLGIGQVLEDALDHFDYIAPMVYPSHYPPNFYGYSNPATSPYDIISIAMKGGVQKATLSEHDPLQLRPWLQDFNLGAVYTADMVRAQIQATYDAGLTSWMMWDPSNRYTRSAFLPTDTDL